MVHIHNGVLVSNKKEQSEPFAETWMDLEAVIESVRQKEKNRYHIISLIC